MTCGVEQRRNRIPPDLHSAQIIADWAKRQASAEHVEFGNLFDMEEVLYRVFLSGAKDPHPEFTIVYPVFEDHPPGLICRMLEREEVIPRILRAPGLRLRLYRDGQVPNYEELSLRCDGRQYRILRTDNRAVTIYDDQGRPLENLPEFLMLPAHIFARSHGQWCEEIKKWRGPRQ